MYCGSGSLVKHLDHRHEARILRCRSWGCPECQPARTKRLIKEGISGSPNTFLTLTTRADGSKTPVEAAKALVRSWRLIRLRWMRLQGLKKLPFLLVVEKHKNGMPHVHILLRAPFIDWKILSGWMAELHNSPRINIQRLRGRASCVPYCAKYCGKAAQQIGNQKRYFKSRDYDLRRKEDRHLKPDDGSLFSRWDRPIWMIRDFWKEKGWRLLSETASAVIFESPGGVGPPGVEGLRW